MSKVNLQAQSDVYHQASAGVFLLLLIQLLLLTCFILFLFSGEALIHLAWPEDKHRHESNT